MEIGRHLLHIFILGIFSVSAIWINPFDFSETTSRVSRDFFYRSWAVQYPTIKSPKVSVILITDNSLTAAPPLSWPLKYSDHAALLHGLRRFSPRAVFIDIAFIDNRADQTLEQLLSQIKIYGEQGIPIYLVAAEMSEDIRNQLRPEFLTLGDAIKLVSVSFDQTDDQLKPYTLTLKNGLFQPAVQMYRDNFCKSAQRKNCHTNFEKFEIWWGAPPLAPNCRSGKDREKCKSISSNWIVRTVRLAARSFFGESLLSRIQFFETDPIPQFYSPTLFFEEIVNGGNEHKLKTFLTDSFVFYGASLAFINDAAYNPVYGDPGRREIPAVHAHAMAFDNLVALDGALINLESPLGSGKMRDTIIVLFALTTMLILRCLFTYSVLTVWYVELFFVSVFVLFVCIAEFFYFHSSPGNWLGTVVSLGTGSLLFKKELVFDWADRVFY